MKMFKQQFLRAFLRKWLKHRTGTLMSYYYDHHWSRLRFSDDEEYDIPKDVPKGHLVVYVGEELKRFVIHVSFLDHPLFRALLDRAKEVYDFNSDSKLRIPCDEAVFLGVLAYVGLSGISGCASNAKLSIPIKK